MFPGRRGRKSKSAKGNKPEAGVDAGAGTAWEAVDDEGRLPSPGWAEEGAAAHPNAPPTQSEDEPAHASHESTTHDRDTPIAESAPAFDVLEAHEATPAELANHASPRAVPPGFHMPNVAPDVHPHRGDAPDEGPATEFGAPDEETNQRMMGRASEKARGAIAAPDFEEAMRGHHDPAMTRVHGGAASTEAPVTLAGTIGDDPEASPDPSAEPSEPAEPGFQDTVKQHRFGLRFGEHLKGNLLDKLRTKLGLEKAEEAPAAAEPEPDEGPAHELERIEPNDRYQEIETYPIHPPYASIRILFDDENKEHIYQVLEPELSKTERDILAFIEETLIDTLTVAPDQVDDTSEADFITDRFNDVVFDYSIILHEDEQEEDRIKEKLLYYVHRDFIGHGPLDAMMSDPYIEDISCDGPFLPIFLYHRRYESMRSTVFFKDHDTLDSYVIKMAQRAGKHISIAEPILDATMTDGSRLQSTLGKEVSSGGSTFTIRKFRPDPFTPPDLVLFRTMSAEMLSYMWITVQHGGSILYAGGTASGKTTSLNAILLFIPPQMKIVSIEDTREVNLPHENWIAGITRTGFGPRDQHGRQAGEIDMFQLLKNALRQRPEYIIVGEVRGQEAYSLFQAMATGHAAYGTMHADSVDAVIHRLESDPINIPRPLLEALDVVSVQIQTRVGGKRVRRTKQISEIVGIDPHTREVLTNEVFRWIPKDDSFKFSGVSYTLERIQVEKGLPGGSMLEELRRRSEIIRWMIERRIQDYKEVSKVVSSYYREPEMVMDMVHGRIDPQSLSSSLREIVLRDTSTKSGPAGMDDLLGNDAIAAAVAEPPAGHTADVVEQNVPMDEASNHADEPAHSYAPAFDEPQQGHQNPDANNEAPAFDAPHEGYQNQDDDNQAPPFDEPHQGHQNPDANNQAPALDKPQQGHEAEGDEPQEDNPPAHVADQADDADDADDSDANAADDAVNPADDASDDPADQDEVIATQDAHPNAAGDEPTWHSTAQPPQKDQALYSGERLGHDWSADVPYKEGKERTHRKAGLFDEDGPDGAAVMTPEDIDLENLSLDYGHVDHVNHDDQGPAEPSRGPIYVDERDPSRSHGDDAPSTTFSFLSPSPRGAGPTNRFDDDLTPASGPGLHLELRAEAPHEGCPDDGFPHRLPGETRDAFEARLAKLDAVLLREAEENVEDCECLPDDRIGFFRMIGDRRGLDDDNVHDGSPRPDEDQASSPPKQGHDANQDAARRRVVELESVQQKLDTLLARAPSAKQADIEAKQEQVRRMLDRARLALRDDQSSDIEPLT